MEAATGSIGLTEGVTAAKLELKAWLQQYALFTQQLEDTMSQVEVLLEQIPGTQEMLTIPGVGVTTL